MSARPYDLYRDLGALPASVGARVAAAAIDGLILALVGGVAFLGFGLPVVGSDVAGATDPDGLAGAGPLARSIDGGQLAFLLAPVFLVWLWNRVVRVSQSGASVGMGMQGIRLVSVRTGTSPTADQAVVRSMVGLLLALPACAGFVTLFGHHQKRGLHDLAAGVVIIAPPE